MDAANTQLVGSADRAESIRDAAVPYAGRERVPADARGRHGERSRVQLLFKLAATVTAVLDFWLGKFGRTSLYKSVVGTLFQRSSKCSGP